MQSVEAKQIQAHIANNGTMKSWVADQAGISRSMLTRFLKGERQMDSEKIKAVKKALKM